jgi:HK97 family phage major capsid protein/HK97 family phage prohead protease
MERDEIQKRTIGKIQHRSFEITRDAVNDETKTVTLAFASQAPVERFYGIEILDCKPESVRLGRLLNKAALLSNHDWDDQIGVVESAVVDADGVCRAVVRFSENPGPQEVFSDVKNGIKTKISVGYMVHEMVLDKKEEETSTYRITDWEPYEISIVSIPADDTVGIGRSMSEEEINRRIMDKVTELINKTNQPHISQERTMDTNEKPVPTTEQILATERQRVTQIETIAKKFAGRVAKIEELRDSAVAGGATVEMFKGAIADRVADGEPVAKPDSQLDLTDKEKKDYSLLRAIQSQIPNSRVKADFERECSDEIAKRTGEKPKGLYVPHDIQRRNMSRNVTREELQHLVNMGFLGKRDLLVSSATQAGNLVGTDLLGGDFISLLRNRTAAGQFGVRIMSGLVGNVAIPKQTAAGTFEWVTEGNAPNESQLTVGQVTMSPNVGAAYQEFSTKLLLQSTPSVEAIVQEDLYQIAALGIDASVFHGAGGSEPQGIYGTSGVGTVDASSLGWPGVVEFETDVATGNADVANMAYVMNAAARGILKTRPKETGNAIYLMSENGLVNGYRSIVSNQINSGYMFFGDGSQAIIGEWGMMDLIVNPYTGDTAGLVRVTIHVHVDVGIRHAAAFAVASNLS